MNPRRPLVSLLLVLTLASLAIACGGGPKEDPVMRLSAAEALAEGKRLLDAEKYTQARKYLQHAFEVEPNSVSGREGLLLAADSLFLEGGSSNLVQAEAKYRDFLNRFPTSDRADYVQYQVANALAGRLERPDRDQTATREALAAYQELLRLFPDSSYVDPASAQIDALRNRLAEHEYVVGVFYARYGMPAAAVNRFRSLLEQYPGYPEKDKVYFHLGTSLRRTGENEEARQWFERLREEYPESTLVADIPAPEREG